MIPDQVLAWPRDQRSRPRNELLGREPQRDGAVAPWCLQGELHSSIVEPRQAIVRDRRPEQIAAELLSPGAVGRRDRHAGVEIEPVDATVSDARRPRQAWIDDATPGETHGLGDQSGKLGLCARGIGQDLVVEQACPMGRPPHLRHAVLAAAVLWSAAYGLCAVRYWPVLTPPRSLRRPLRRSA